MSLKQDFATKALDGLRCIRMYYAQETSSQSADLGLGLQENQLETLPETLRALSLRDLVVHRNPALGLPDSILDRPPAEILRYYFESRDEKGRPLLELKLLLVGRGGAGKTTLVKRLAGEAPDAHELETHSIAIRELTLACPRGQVRTRAWDFGGQEILHATHQFFLTERSLYLLVLEPRSGLAQRDAGAVEVVVVKLEPCACDDDPFLGKLQRLAPKLGSIAEVSPKSKAWEQVRKDLLPVIQRVRRRKEGAVV
jgi:hypothetical protein